MRDESRKARIKKARMPFSDIHARSLNECVSTLVWMASISALLLAGAAIEHLSKRREDVKILLHAAPPVFR